MSAIVPTEPARTPSWLVKSEVGLCPCGCIGTRKKGSFVEKTLAGASNVMRQAMFSDDVSAQNGLLQKIDPRVKILSLLGLLIATAFIRNIPALLVMYAGTLLLAAASGLPLSFFIKRVWLFIPIFTGIVVLPATFSFITHGHIVLPLWSWGGHQVGITSQGLGAAGLIVASRDPLGTRTGTTRRGSGSWPPPRARSSERRTASAKRCTWPWWRVATRAMRRR